MQKDKYRKILSYLSVTTVFFFGCSLGSVPENYKNVVSEFVKETEKIEAIPIEKKRIKTDSETYQSMISLEKRAEYFANNKDIWNKIFADFEQVKDTLQATDWFDDILFCMALGYLKASNLDDTGRFTDNAISSISDFIGINENSNIEEWTKKELKSVFWSNLATYFTETVSEKKNIDQFLYIARASLWENKKNNPEKAIEDYNKALVINPDSFWGKQAQNQIQLLQKGEKGSPISIVKGS